MSHNADHTQTPTNAKLSNYLRQACNLSGALFMWTAASWPQVTGYGRSAKEFSDLNDSLLVPFGAAFSIWLPIFVLCLAYAVLQALPVNRTRDIFRVSGWWTALSFACVGLWSITAYFAALETAKWLTIVIFIPVIGGAIQAVRTMQHRRVLTRAERYLMRFPIALLGGWTSLAGFLNLTPFITDRTTLMPQLTASITLSAAIVFAAIMTVYLKRPKAYIFAITWGLLWLAFERLIQTNNTPIIGWVALSGVVSLILIAIIPPRSAKP